MGHFQRTEITKIVKDNQGNEEKTVTYKFGDKEHTVVTRRDKDGKEEITENLVNMDSNDLNKLWMKDEKANDIAELKTPKTWFPFDFFK